MSPVQSAGKDAKSTKDSADSKGDSKDEAVPKKMTRAAAKAGATKVAAVAAEEVPSELKSAEENPTGEDSDSKDSKDATKTRPRRAAAKEKIPDEAATTEDTLGAIQPESESAGKTPDAKDASVPKDSKDATKSKKQREADKGPSSKGKIQEEATETSDGSTAKLPESAIAGENLAAAASTSSKDLTNVRKTRTATKAESSKGNVPEEVHKVADKSVGSESTAVEKDSQEDNSTTKDTTKNKKARAKVVAVKSDTPAEATETDAGVSSLTETDAGVSSLTKTCSNEGISASKDTDDAKDSKQTQTKATSTSKKNTADEDSSGNVVTKEQLIPEKPIETDKHYRVYIFLSQFRVNDIVVRLIPIEIPVEKPVAGPSGTSASEPSGTSASGPSGTAASGPSGTAASGPTSMAALAPFGTSFSGPSGTSFTVPYATEATGPHGTTASLPRGTATSGPSGKAALEPFPVSGNLNPVVTDYKIVGHYVVIDARHSEHVDEHGYVTRSFSRRINLPRNVIGGELKCFFTGNGILVLEAPLEKTLIDLLTDDAKDPGLIVKTIQPLLA